MEVLEDEQYQRSATYYKDVQEQFRQVSNSFQMDIERWYQRLADNNGISYASAKRFLRESELDEFRWTIEQYIQAGHENAIDQRWMKELENASARHHIDYLTAMKMQAQQYAELLSTEFEGGMTDFLHQSFSEQYYRTAWEMANGTGVGSNLARIDARKIDALIKRPWAQDGKNFSGRIWTNKERLVNNLHRELSQCIIRGDSPKKAIGRLAREMNVSQNQAGNLIMTESAAISSAAQKECFRELDVERYLFDATLDGKTCDVCGGMDQMDFKLSEYEVGITAPPIHPRCRCCTVPFFDDWEEYGIRNERAARDSETGKTIYVDGRLSYKEWREKYIDNSRENVIIKVMKDNGIRGNPVWDAKPMDVSNYHFDDKHINKEREHGVSRAEAEFYVKDAVLVIERWNGRFINYYSEEGAAYIDREKKEIRTAFRKNEYDEQVQKLIEAVMQFE